MEEGQDPVHDESQIHVILKCIFEAENNQPAIGSDVSFIVKDIETLITEGHFQDARGMLDRMVKGTENLGKLKYIHGLFCEHKAFEQAIDTMEMILEIEPTLTNIEIQIENCYDIYKRKKAVQTINKYLGLFNGTDHSWLLVELADYLIFFERQYSKAYLIYEELYSEFDDETVLGLNVLIGKQLAEYLQSKEYNEETFYKAIRLCNVTGSINCTPRQKSYMLLKLGKLFYNMARPSLAVQCLYDAHNADLNYTRPLFMLISLLELQERMDLARPLLQVMPGGHYKTYYYLAVYKESTETHTDAITLFTRSITLNKNYAKSYHLRGFSHLKIGHFNQALEDFMTALSIDPNQVQTQMYAISVKQMLGIFSSHEQEKNDIAVILDQYLHKAANHEFTMNVMKPSDRPPMGLHQYYIWDLPFDQMHKLGLITSVLNQKENELVIEEDRPKIEPFTFQHLEQQLSETHQKSIKVGFIIPESIDGEFMETFGEFFRMFDQKKVMVYLYTMDKISNNSVYEQRLRNEVTVYTSFFQMNALESANKIYEHKINILISMCIPGLNKECQICELRPSPIEILYFSTPGSSGMRCFDYILADKYLCPIEEHCLYTEQIIMLPGSFASASHEFLCENAVLEEEREEFLHPIENKKFVFTSYDNDTAQNVISVVENKDASKKGIYFPVGRKVMRTDFGIPEDAFVFATFSQFFKFNPQFLDLIIAVLSSCIRAHYLMIQLPPEAVPNITQYIQIQNQEVLQRVHFLQAYNENLAIERIRRSLIVDVYIDATKLSGSIILDTLFAGTVVVCHKGGFLGQRITGSFLHQIGLGELICPDMQAMLSKCCLLYNDVQYFHRCKQIILDNYKQLFDLKQFIADFTVALESVYQIWQNGLDPHSFEVQRLMK